MCTFKGKQRAAVMSTAACTRLEPQTHSKRQTTPLAKTHSIALSSRVVLCFRAYMLHATVRQVGLCRYQDSCCHSEQPCQQCVERTCVSGGATEMPTASGTGSSANSAGSSASSGRAPAATPAYGTHALNSLMRRRSSATASCGSRHVLSANETHWGVKHVGGEGLNRGHARWQQLDQLMWPREQLTD